MPTKRVLLGAGVIIAACCAASAAPPAYPNRALSYKFEAVVP
jgi:hypothetical protein